MEFRPRPAVANPSRGWGATSAEQQQLLGSGRGEAAAARGHGVARGGQSRAAWKETNGGVEEGPNKRREKKKREKTREKNKKRNYWQPNHYFIRRQRVGADILTASDSI